MSAPVQDPKVATFHARRFALRPGGVPLLARASGDSGFVAHLTACTRGATGWDWSFRLVRAGPDWAFVSDGKVTLYVDEPGQYVPAEAKGGDVVALRLPRARENLHPHRFSLYGGQGGCVVGHGYAKLFLPVTFEAAPLLVETFASRAADQLRFSLYVSNDAQDFMRADAAIIDVGTSDEAGVLKVLEPFIRQHTQALAPRGLPWGTMAGPLGLARVEVKDRGDRCDGFGWRRSTEAVAAGGH